MRKAVPIVVAVLLAATLIAHPHFTKTVAAKTPEGEISLSFMTYPYSDDHLAQVSEGFVFHCGRAKLTSTAALSAAGQPIPAGDYLVRAVANSVDDWTLILIPAEGMENSNSADLSKGMRLSSRTQTGLPSSHHLDVDLYSGHDETDGKLILAVSFGERRVEGVLELN